MKRFHVHVAVADLERSAHFYSALFGMQPTVRKDDYAKWMLDEPRLNFAISERANAAGVNHLGFQAETDSELEALHARLQSADAAIVAEKGTNCCYATSDKYWVQDPSGIAWESFRSLDTVPFYGDHEPKTDPGSGCGTTCCPEPTPSATNACCSA